MPRSKKNNKGRPKRSPILEKTEGLYVCIPSMLKRRAKIAVFRADVTMKQWITSLIEKECVRSEMGEPSIVESWAEDRVRASLKSPLQKWLNATDLQVLSTITEIPKKRLEDMANRLRELPTPGEQAVLESLGLGRWVVPASAEMAVRAIESEGIELMERAQAERIEFQKRQAYGVTEK